MTDSPLADETTPVRVLERERVFTGKVWNIVRERFVFGDGELTREFMDHTGAVAVLAQDEQGRVLLAKQYRHPVGQRLWELPAGLLDVDGEPPLEAAKRELAEEADLVAEEWQLLAQHASTPGGSNEIITVYLARGLSAAPEVFARTGEEAEIELRWVPLAEAVEGVLDGRLRNGPLQLALLTAWARFGGVDAADGAAGGTGAARGDAGLG